MLSCLTKVVLVEWGLVEKPTAAGWQCPLEARLTAAQPGMLSQAAKHSATLPIIKPITRSLCYNVA